MPASGWARPQVRFCTASAKPNSSRPQPRAPVIGSRHRPCTWRAPSAMPITTPAASTISQALPSQRGRAGSHDAAGSGAEAGEGAMLAGTRGVSCTIGPCPCGAQARFRNVRIRGRNAMPAHGLPSLDLLRGFVAVGRRMSITLAARDLFLTQSAVSRQIHALEEQLGLPLFTRGYRSIAFTPEGERLFRSADAALRQLQEAVADLASHRRA